MNFDKAQKIYQKIDSTTLFELKEDLYNLAIRYAKLRTDWYLADLDSRKELDKPRTVSHDAFIDSCNILSRNMAEAGEDNSWRERLGDNRKEIGDFACYLSCILGIKAR